MNLWRSLLAVVAGFFIVALLSVGADAVMRLVGVFPDGRMPDGLFIVPAIYRAVFTALGGYATARLAPARPMVHAAVLGAFGLLGGLGGLAAALENPELGPLWYAASIPASALPCIWLGARLGSRG